jgi:hypothetical protein
MEAFAPQPNLALDPQMIGMKYKTFQTNYFHFVFFYS